MTVSLQALEGKKRVLLLITIAINTTLGYPVTYLSGMGAVKTSGRKALRRISSCLRGSSKRLHAHEACV